VNHLLFWIAFNVLVAILLALDLGVLQRKSHTIKFREALLLSLVWIALAVAFAGLLYFWRGRVPALEFATGYLIELSLSVDNLFIFLLIFRYFDIPSANQHKVLYWGILGALLMRATFILVGVTLLRRFEWIIYFFGALLLVAGIRLFRSEEMEVNPEGNWVVRIFRRFMPVTKEFQGNKFFVRRGRLYATPLLIVLLVIETTDLLFAVDSIPAVLAITRDAFIVYTSNVFAILGLRSMYFALAGLMEIFHLLHYGLAVILIFIGGKMLVSHYYPIKTEYALAAVAAVLTISILASLLFPKRNTGTSNEI
jgi:TerC family integral membrane protein